MALAGDSSPMRIPQIPMEWMDPMSWRLPSGKALAEFALQAGFLAPLMLGAPAFKKRKKPAEPPVAGTGVKAGIEDACWGGGRNIPAPFGKHDERASVDRDSGGAGGDGR